MGLISRLFGGGSINSTVRNLTTSFERDRKEWYPFFVESIERRIPFLGDDSAIKSVKNRSLEDNGEIILKAFQVYWTIIYVFKHQYIQQSNFEEFSTLLWGYLFNGESDADNQRAFNACKQILSGYMNTDGPDNMIGKFNLDMVMHITGADIEKLPSCAEDLVRLSRALLNDIEAFQAVTHGDIADTFGDKETYQKLLSGDLSP